MAKHLPIDTEQVACAAEEMIAKHGDAALARADEQIRTCESKSQLPQRAQNFIICLFGIDALFIGFGALIYALRYFGMEADGGVLDRFSIGRDRGFPEMFNYLKVSIIVAVLTATYLRSRVTPCLIIALCFAYVGLDDSLRIHEQLGAYLADSLALPAIAGMSAEALGQVLGFAAVGSVITSAFVIGWLYTDATYRRLFLVFAILLCALSFFAVLVDALHQMARSHSRVISGLLGLIEDGGEMLVITLSCWVAFGVFSNVSYHHVKSARYGP